MMLYLYIFGFALGLGVLVWQIARKVMQLRDTYRSLPRSLADKSVLADTSPGIPSGTAWWDILGIPQNATTNDVERAYEQAIAAERRRVLMGGRREIIENGSRIPLLERARADALAQLGTSRA